MGLISEHRHRPGKRLARNADKAAKPARDPIDDPGHGARVSKNGGGVALQAPKALTQEVPPGQESEDEAQIADLQYASGLQRVAAAQADDIGTATMTFLKLMSQRPDIAYEKICRYWIEQFWINAGVSSVAPAKGDHRFNNPNWTANPFYKWHMQTHLSLRNTIEEWVNALPLDHNEADRIRFTLSLLNEASAPSNWPTNPGALQRYFETGGESAIRGLSNVVDDLVHNAGMPSMVKRGALKVGVDMGGTPGKVVHRCEMFELLQFAPITDKVHARPYLMIPPQINKFYFYDLSPGKSLIRFALESGLQVFTISWRNPLQEHRHWNFDAYISAIEQAIDATCEITGSPDCNIEAGCVAGMEVCALLASHARRGERKVNSATLMVTQLDTDRDSLMHALATPGLLEAARANSATKGLMDGSEMGRMFAMLRPTDLIWSYWVNNYLLGNDPPTFDVLAWNADTTRMAAGLHLDILDIVQNNTLACGMFKVSGTPVQLGAIDCDQFWMAASADHIAPWRSVYASARLLGGKREFVLSDGGHIQGMISSPRNPKAKFYVGAEQPEDADAWLAASTEHNSSWWLYWREWITRRSGDLRTAPDSLGSTRYAALTDAPGTYVFQ